MASKIIRKGKSGNLRRWKLKDGTVRPLFYEIKNKFFIFLRQYFAGVWDGDGYQRNYVQKGRHTKTLELSLEMAENGKEPVLFLAELFDLTIRRVIRKGKKYKNYQPTYIISLSGPKAEMFMLLIYPYLIENRSTIQKILLERGCPKDLLYGDRQFSWPYCAGYSDAEGHYAMRLLHQKHKCKNGYRISSSYKFRFNLSSNDFESLKFIKQQIIDRGFQFRKDYIETYKERNNENLNPTLRIDLRGGPKELSRFYKNFYFYSLIHKKKDVMKKTMEYSEIILEK